MNFIQNIRSKSVFDFGFTLVSCGNASKKHWRMSRVKWVVIVLPKQYFFYKGLFLPGNQTFLISRTAVYAIRMYGAVGGALSNGRPYPYSSFYFALM
jgi:hypothetical protein